MILLGLMELTGRKITIPMLHLTIDLTNRHDPWSIYVLGIFSGLTTSCCTPVLAGILTLSFLSPSFFWAGLAGLSYVFGMVVPLVVVALTLEKINWIGLAKLKGKTTDVIAGVLFILVGITFTSLALTGRITMGTQTPMAEGLVNIVRWVRGIAGSEFFIIFIMVITVITVIKRQRRSS